MQSSQGMAWRWTIKLVEPIVIRLEKKQGRNEHGLFYEQRKA